MKRVLITGCSSGIGRMLVRSFLDDGWMVIATLRRASERQEIFHPELADYPNQLVVKSLDVTSEDDRQKIADYVDVSGSLETNKKKDLNKIKKFLLEIKKITN